MDRIKFGKLVEFLGRNGYFKMSGVEVWSYHERDRIVLEPVTSKGSIGRCSMAIPIEDVEKVIGAIRKIAGTPKNNMNHRLATALSKLEKAISLDPNHEESIPLHYRGAVDRARAVLVQAGYLPKNGDDSRRQNV